MPPRLDAERLRIDLAVADLLDTVLLRHIGFGTRGGYERLWLGQAIHSHYQEEALAEDPTYRREVAVVLEYAHRGWVARIQGRIDGLRRREDGTIVVEEIKSVRRGATLSAVQREIYERQALLYAWMLHRQRQGQAEPAGVAAELVLIEIGSDAVHRESLNADFEALEGQVKRRLNQILRSYEGEKQAGFRRRAAGESLRFPYRDLRPGQERIVEAVEGAIERGEHLLVEATTGIGKTVAALYPALRRALLADQKVYVLTAKTLQQDMATAVLKLLNAGNDFRALRLRAKSKMCANDELLCHEEYCRFAKDYFAKLESTQLVPRLLAERATLEPDDVYAAARQAETCPFEVSLDLEQKVQVTVCDYNYAFDPYVALGAFAADADLSDTILVIDEIHNLVERGRSYWSPELDAASARTAAEAMRLGREPVHQQIEDLCLDLALLIERTAHGALEEGPPGMEAMEAALPEDALWQMRPHFDAAFVDYLEHQRQTKSFRPDDPFVGLYFDVLRFLNGLLVADQAFSRCVELRGGSARLRIFCRDPGRFIGGVINRAHSVIGLSATLSPTEFYRDLLGFDPARTTTLAVPNPFPARHRRVVVDTTVTTTWRERPQQVARIAERLGAFTDAVPGNCLALFPSYDFLAQVAEQLKPRNKRVLVQRRADTDAARESILETLRTALLGDVLLLAVAGGVFAEGVDYPGEMLRAVAVVGPCLPGVSLEIELLKTYYQERFERGFEYSFVVPGMTRVVQAAGRLIRSPTDVGVIALFDRRFLQPPYRDHLPADWLENGAPSVLVGDPSLVARDFFRALDRPAATAAGNEPLAEDES